MPDTTSLYERDFYTWTQDQAARLRAWPEQLRPNGLDIGNLAEEVEDIGSAQRRSVESFLHLIALHLLKVEFHPQAETRSHWMVEIDAFRTSLDREFRDSPSLRSHRAKLLPEAWRTARRDVRRQLARDFPDAVGRFDRAVPTDAPPRYNIDTQLLADGWYPEPRAE